MKYASLTTIWEHIREPLSASGLAVTQGSSPDMSEDGHLIYETTLLHTSGEWITFSLPIKPKNDDPQGMGSTVTYARRYSLCAILGIVADEDDDGEVAQARKQPEKKPEPKSQPATPPQASQPADAPMSTVKQQNAMYAIAKKMGYDAETPVSIMTMKFHKTSSKDLTIKEASDMIELLTSGYGLDEKWNEPE